MKKTILLLALVTILYLLGFFLAFSYLFEALTPGKLLDLSRNIVEYSVMFVSLIIFCSVLLKNKFTSVIAYILIFLATLNFGLSIGAALIYKSDVNIGMILSIMDTNINEAVSMSTMFILPSVIGLIMLALSIHCAITIKNTIRLNWKTAVISSLWILMPFIFFMKHKYISNKGGGKMIKNVFYLSNYIDQSLQIRKESEEISAVQPSFDVQKIDEGVQNIILIIGESARKQNFSLYGYHKKTTPYEDAEKKNMLLFENAVSPAGITNLSVPLVLSTVEPSEFQAHFNKISDNIINLSNHVGYKTSWISMQGAARGITSIANMSTYKKWLNGYDEVSISHLKEILNPKTKNLVVIHLNGSHPNPCDRIPPEEKSDELNCYDQSIQYTDKLLGQVFKFSKNNNTVVIYFSDHGVKIKGNKFLHTDSKESTQVPFFIWYSDDIADRYREIGTVNQVTQTTKIFPLLSRFMGLKEPEKYKDERLKYLKLDLSVIPYSELKE